MTRFERKFLVFAVVASVFVGGAFALAAVAGADLGAEVFYGPIGGFAVVGLLTITLTALALVLALIFAVMSFVTWWVGKADY